MSSDAAAISFRMNLRPGAPGISLSRSCARTSYRARRFGLIAAARLITLDLAMLPDTSNGFPASATDAGEGSSDMP